MNYQLFGTKTGLWVSELALGTAMFGTAAGYGAEPAEARRIWEGYVEAGGNFIDTSDAYQQGEAERLVGQFMGASRGDFVLTSKYTRTDNPTAAIAQLGNHRKAMTQGTRAQLDGQLVAAAIKLSSGRLLRLHEVSAVPMGYPHELLAAQQGLLTGNRADQVAWPARVVG